PRRGRPARSFGRGLWGGLRAAERRPYMLHMVPETSEVDPHRNTVSVPQGDFRIYREDDRYMVARVPDGALLGYFLLELSTSGRVVVRARATGQLGLGTFDEARDLLDVIGGVAVRHGIARP